MRSGLASQIRAEQTGKTETGLETSRTSIVPINQGMRRTKRYHFRVLRNSGKARKKLHKPSKVIPVMKRTQNPCQYGNHKVGTEL